MTRPSVGSLGELLRLDGADVVHLPLIEIAPPGDGGEGLRAALRDLGRYEWLVVTSVNGARAVGDTAAKNPAVRLAAVGTTTATELSRRAGRAVDLIPRRQRVAGLLAEFPTGPGTVLVAQADRAGSELADGLIALGGAVTVVEAYRTALWPPSEADAAVLAGSDAVVVASGSAVEAWLSTVTEPATIGAAVVAIGPQTADFAQRNGLRVSAVADTPADADVVAAVNRALR